ncbi:MAG: hypothetical protein WA628_25110 [Terriglobales bacterium]
MTTEKSKQSVRPLRVFVGHGTKAEKGFHARMSMPIPEAIAPGIAPTPAHDLIFHGGHTIADLVFTNFYVGGAAAWKTSDIQNIDKGLAAAMSDVNLNNVMSQYYPAGKITSAFGPSQTLAGPPPKVFSQGDVENLVQQLFTAGTIKGFDFASTVFNIMLPSGTILNTDTSPTGNVAAAEAEKSSGKKRIPVEEEEDSTQGLGGYHGSIHVSAGASDKIIYYAVGVFSESLPDGTVNGIPVFDQSWKNVVATFYHELNEARTDPDVEDAIRAGNDPNATKFLGWTSKQGEECGDFPVFEANPLSQVFKEVKLTDGSGTAPVQFQYSDSAHGPEGPRSTPAPFAGKLQAKGAGHAHGSGKGKRT